MAIARPTIIDAAWNASTNEWRNEGTVIDNAFFQRIFNYIDARVAEGQQAAKAAIEARQAAETASKVAEAAADRAMRFKL